MTAPRICEVGGWKQGLFLPSFGDAEANWPDWLQSILYLIGLLWCFMGVAIIADVFMGAIETVTSKKIRVRNSKTGKEATVKVWNDTVANLTLMALGSSAPEILLNIKEIFENKFYAGALGPMTIVGSAAFNLMCIIAVCVSAIPSGEKRLIKDLPVYSVTAFFSIFAYVWLYIILVGPTPNSVDVAEGICTFLFFPLLLVIAFMADKGKLPGMRPKPVAGDTVVHPESTKEELEQMAEQVKGKYGDDLTEMQIAALIDFEFSQGQAHSRAYHRVNATRFLVRGKTLKASQGFEEGRMIASALATEKGSLHGVKVDGPIVGFAKTDYVVLESKGPVQLKVTRTNDLSQEIAVGYCTEDGSAKEGSDYERTEDTLLFKAGETEKTFTVAIIDDPDGHEETEHFFVNLRPVEDGQRPKVTLSKASKCRVHIVDENHPGKLAFEQEQTEVNRPKELLPLEITVERRRGYDGQVECEWYTEQDSATAGMDFEASSGKLIFAHQQHSAKFQVNILPKQHMEGKEAFRVILKDSSGKAMFDETTDGGKDSAILTVFIVPPTGKSGTAVINAFRLNHDQMKVGHTKWREQFSAAICCNGDEEGEAEATKLDWAIHFIALPWKVFFALVPPVEYGGGWVCFGVALFMIAIVTILIGDLATMLGCAMSIPDFATAITIVALGTSLPDTFASKTAAVQDMYADASIGNVTGSNSVNVFLGLGLPWMIGAIYWACVETKPGDEWYLKYPDLAKQYPKGAFIVKSDGIGLSVGVFSGCSLVCLGTLALRRKVFGAELGGPDKPKWATSIFFALLWVVYIVVSIANAPA